MFRMNGTSWMLDPGKNLRFEPARPRLVRFAFADHPTVGVLNTLQVKSRHASSASLNVRQDGEELFNGDIPPNAEIGITPPTPAEIVVSLTLEPAHVVHSFRVRPKVLAPVFSKIDVAHAVNVGDSLPVVWEASKANSVTLHVEDGEERTEHTGTSAGLFMLRPTRPGLIVVRFVAHGSFATKVETRTILVTIPVPRIEVDPPVQAGYPGTDVTFQWRISGAREAYIEAPQRGEQHGIAIDGGMVVKIESTPEEFHLVAVAMDGSRHIERLATIPRVIACLDES